MMVYDTYLPAELEKILSNLKLNGRIITKIEEIFNALDGIQRNLI